jgi:hypothetical protein
MKLLALKILLVTAALLVHLGEETLNGPVGL